MKGVSTVIATILMLIIVIALAGMAYMYIAGVFTGTVQGIEIVDSFCEGGEVTMIIRNIGTTPITSLDIKQTSPPDDPITLPPALFLQGSIDPGKTISYKDMCEGLTGRTCIYRIVPPIGRAATASAFCATKPTSLVLSLHFDEDSGINAKDSSGNGNDGILINMEAGDWVPGRYGNALEFDGTQEYVSVSDSSDFVINDEITIEMWVNVITQDQNWEEFIRKGGDRLETGFVGQNGIWWMNGYTPNVWEFNQWFHLVFVSKSTPETRLFINGVEVSNSPIVFTQLPFDAGELRIGSGFAETFNGKIDEVRIYNKALI